MRVAPDTRRCIFCGSGSLTREHVLPRWLEGVLPGAGPFRIRHDDAVDPHRLREWLSPRLNAVARSVCGGCNSGWMAALEDAARPILAPLIKGEPSRLPESDLGTIAFWAAKTMFMVDLTLAVRAVPASAFAEIYRLQAPPRTAAMLLSGYAGTRTSTYRGSHLELRGSKSGREGNGYTTALQLGALAIQLIAHDMGTRPAEVDVGGAAPFLLPLRPVHGAQDWPPPALLRSDPDLTVWTQAFLPEHLRTTGFG